MPPGALHAAGATDPTQACCLRLRAQQQDSNTVRQAKSSDSQHQDRHHRTGAPLLLASLGIRLLHWNQGNCAETEHRGTVRKNVGPSHSVPKAGRVCEVVAWVGQVWLEEAEDLVAYSCGDGLTGMHHRPNETVAESFTPRLCHFNDNQVQDQGKSSSGHSTKHVLPQEEVLVPNHTENCKEARDGVGDRHPYDCKEDCLAPGDLEEVLLVHPSCDHHDQHAAHHEHLLLQDLDPYPLTADHWPGSGRDGGKELHDEGEEQHSGEAFLLHQLPGRFHMCTA
mmetsp:Transcript_42156/g.98407  ORF Transcript_42156/g.98407 Transcript_42156/m.98407 type:complete len:281 (+) Transcript_42156:210-1052(+)